MESKKANTIIEIEDAHYLYHSTRTSGVASTRLLFKSPERYLATLCSEVRNLLASFKPLTSDHLDNIHRLKTSYYYSFEAALTIYCTHFGLCFTIYDPKQTNNNQIFLSKGMVDRLAMHGFNLDEIKEKAAL